MADDGNNNDGGGKKNKGGGNQQKAGLSLGSNFDAANCNSVDDIKRNAGAQVANSVGMIAGTVLAGLFMLGIRKAFKLNDKPAPQGGASVQHPGQILGIIKSMKNHPDYGKIAPQIAQMTAPQQPAPAPVIEATPVQEAPEPNS